MAEIVEFLGFDHGYQVFMIIWIVSYFAVMEFVKPGHTQDLSQAGHFQIH